MATECDNKSVLDLSKQCLKKVPKQDDAQNVKVLILDENELQKIDNIDSYLRIEKLSLCKNQLLRMYGVCRLHQLQELHLAYNGILTIEGLKELSHLTHLNLEGNNIKAIEHLNTNSKLEYLNLSENSIGNISDISYLKCLKELSLHGNRITHLRQCEKYLPISLEHLTLAKNGITDLNEICSLSHLINLESISVNDNPCVQMVGISVGFDYRPFVLNWCMTVKCIDGFMVNPLESLRAEWLYSQGRGRQFRIGEQQALARYLSTVCPLSGEVLENENERKLRLILSKAQQHQRQLQEEISENAITSGSNSPSSSRRKGQSSRIQSPRCYKIRKADLHRMDDHRISRGSSRLETSTRATSQQVKRRCTIRPPDTTLSLRLQEAKNAVVPEKNRRFSRLGRQGSPDSMSSSYHGNTSSSLLLSQNDTTGGNGPMSTSLISGNIHHKDSNNIMVQSLDPTILGSRISASCGVVNAAATAHQQQYDLTMRSSQSNIMMTSSQFNEQLSQNRQGSSPLAAASKMVPVPESLMSPDCPPPGGVGHRSGSAAHHHHTTAAYSPKSAKSKSESKNNNGGGSPKINRPLLPKKQIEKSPILNHSRKTTQNLANTMRINAEHQFAKQQQQLQMHQQKPLAASVVHVTPPEENNSCAASSDDDDSDHINVDKLKTIRNKAAQRNQQKETDELSAISINKQTEYSVILIQKLWRGHQARLKFKDAAKILQKKRTQEYIEKLTADMETTKIALENERKIQQLQMQAINALWKKVSTMQPNSTTAATVPTDAIVSLSGGLADNHSQAIVQDLAKTCTVLTNQVQQLQGSMHDILQHMTVFCSLPQNAPPPPAVISAPPTSRSIACDTQTEIIAVHTPQVDNPPFPFNNKLKRPQTLPLVDSSSETSPLPPHDLTTNSDDIAAVAETPSVNVVETFCKLNDASSPTHYNENTKDLIAGKEE